ncbi:MAG: DegQ family serine endoprotease [Candidatus Acidiferrales bacterium]|jgi:serine protease Do
MESSSLKIRRWVATVVVVAAFAGGALLSQGFRDWAGHAVFGASREPITIAQNALPVSLGNFANGFSAVIKPALPAVVNIRTSKIVKPQANQMSPMFSDPMFRQFFGDQFGQGGKPHAEREQALGSGVIITPDGTILTNNHVIDGATDIKVQLSDKREFLAKLVGADPKSDVAVLKIEGKDLPTLPLGDSSQLNVGDLIFAIGDPFGVGETATMGIVSATGRSRLGIEDYENFIQTDAAINPGNSGGAMIDIHGNLVGINTAILSHGGSGGNEGVGFAIPMSMAKPVMDQILAHGKVIRGYLGVHIQDFSPELAKSFNFNQSGGVLIGDVSANTPAANAGLKKGDVIVKLNGQAESDSNDLRNTISQMSPGTQVKLDIWRDGKVQPFTVTLGELPKDKETAESSDDSSSGEIQGIDVQDLTPEISQQLNLPSGTHGVVVTSVDPASAAAAAGINRGDLIQEINHKPVTSASQYKQLMSGASGQPILLLINRGGITSFVVVEAH